MILIIAGATVPPTGERGYDTKTSTITEEAHLCEMVL